MKKSLCLVLGICCTIWGCSKDECSREDMAYCSENGTSVYVCERGSWTEKPCLDGLACGYVDGSVQCYEAVGSKCRAGEQYCENDIVRTCGSDGVWMYESCGSNKTCGGNSCVDKADIPVQPPVVSPEGLVKRQCSADKKSIEYVDDKGSVTSKTCLEEVGFESFCEEYGAGHVGCALPSSCGDLFTVSGVCRENRRIWCDERFITPKPAMEDCAYQGKICVENDGVAECHERCETPDPDALKCSEKAGIALVERCISSDASNFVQKAASICLDEKTSAACRDGEAVRTVCSENEKCLAVTGTCEVKCSEEMAGEFICSSSGSVLMCSKVGDDFVYISQGRRHCDGEKLIQCIADETESDYELKEVNCAAYENPDGSIIVGKCVSNYQYYEDMDLCIADDGGDPCGDLTESGLCDGNTLKYCDTMMDHAVFSDCSKNKDGYTNCSQYEGYADCRKSCKKSGDASCTYSPNSESYILTLCAPDDKTSKLTEVDGTAICLGNVLYECDINGKSVSTDCSVNGGRCDANRCVYPACTVDAAPICLADDAMISCEVSSDGSVLGAAMQSMTCNPDGNCYVCRSGNVVDATNKQAE